MKCASCQKSITDQDSWWQRLRYWLAWHIFPTDMADERSGAYTQGFSRGYVQGKQEGIERMTAVLKNLDLRAHLD